MGKEHSEHWDSSTGSLEDTYFTAYDKIKFPRRAAERMVSLIPLSQGQCVLDLACGTGCAAMAASRAVGESGRVTGIDIENSWLDIAGKKAVSAGLSNIEYHRGDAQTLEFKDNSFNVVTCASSVFLFKDIHGALKECYRVLKPGGTIALTSFGQRFLEPVIKLLAEGISRFDGLPPAFPVFLDSTNSPEKCRELLSHAGFGDIEVTTEDLGYPYPDPETYWQEMTLTFIGIRMSRLSPSGLEKFKQEHLAEIKSLFKEKDIYIEIPTNICIARKP
jgi:ubiquinone/menaquinone biosynthesis C-methylase UbiE